MTRPASGIEPTDDVIDTTVAGPDGHPAPDDTADAELDPRRGIHSYTRRGERITPGQRRAWDTLWPAYGRTLDDVDTLDVDAWFGRRARLVVEIGTGMGETTAQLAAAAPETNHLGVEVYRPGLASLLMRIEAAGLTNLRLVRGDAVVLLREHLAPGSVDEFRVYFPDPWPKVRHHKRRLVEPGFVALAASRLRPGGVLHLATDWAHYADQMLAACDAEPTLCNLHPGAVRDDGAGSGATDGRSGDGTAGWAPRPAWRPLTKFEARAVEEGRVVRDLLFSRR